MTVNLIVIWFYTVDLSVSIADKTSVIDDSATIIVDIYCEFTLQTSSW